MAFFVRREAVGVVAADDAAALVGRIVSNENTDGRAKAVGFVELLRLRLGRQDGRVRLLLLSLELIRRAAANARVVPRGAWPRLVEHGSPVVGRCRHDGHDGQGGGVSGCCCSRAPLVSVLEGQGLVASPSTLQSSLLLSRGPPPPPPRPSCWWTTLRRAWGRLKERHYFSGGRPLQSPRRILSVGAREPSWLWSIAVGV